MTLAGKIILPLFLFMVVATVLLLVGWQLGLIPAVIEFLAELLRSGPSAAATPKAPASRRAAGLRSLLVIYRLRP